MARGLFIIKSLKIIGIEQKERYDHDKNLGFCLINYNLIWA